MQLDARYSQNGFWNEGSMIQITTFVDKNEIASHFDTRGSSTEDRTESEGGR